MELCNGRSGTGDGSLRVSSGHIALQLLQAGFHVRGSVRSLTRGAQVERALQTAGADISRLELVELDLLDDRGWREAAAGCDYLQHVASPFVLRMPKNKDNLIRPAVEGTRRAMEAALAAGLARVVVTSSLAAIDQGHLDYSRTFTEGDWTELSGPHISAYAESKTLAERLAWDLADAAAARNRLCVINPAAMLGPLLDDDPGTSGSIVVRLLRGAVPMAPAIILEYVDVRDIAAAHVAAMTAPHAGGQRFIVSDESLSLMEVADILRAEFPGFARKLPRKEMPPLLATLLSVFDASIRDSRPFLGVRRRSDSSRCVRLLGRELIPARDAVIALARSAIEWHLV